MSSRGGGKKKASGTRAAKAAPTKTAKQLPWEYQRDRYRTAQAALEHIRDRGTMTLEAEQQARRNVDEARYAYSDAWSLHNARGYLEDELAHATDATERARIHSNLARLDREEAKYAPPQRASAATKARTQPTAWDKATSEQRRILDQIAALPWKPRSGSPEARLKTQLTRELDALIKAQGTKATTATGAGKPATARQPRSRARESA